MADTHFEVHGYHRRNQFNKKSPNQYYLNQPESKSQLHHTSLLYHQNNFPSGTSHLHIISNMGEANVSTNAVAGKETQNH